MKHFIRGASLIAAVAFFANTAFASMDDDLHAVCMKDSNNNAESCSCAVALVKTNMEPEAFALLHALATTEDGSEERVSKITALVATPEQLQGVGEKFRSLVEQIQTQCNVTINNTDSESEG